jgi:ribosome modulation factor
MASKANGIQKVIARVTEEGRRAALEGRSESDCPYRSLDAYTHQKKWWWLKGFREVRRVGS